MEDINNIKPYITHLNHQLRQLRSEIDKLTAKSLDEQLMIENDERKKLDHTNRYAYVLSTLCFIYMKICNVKDMSPIMTELGRCKSYMDQAKKLDSNKTNETKNMEIEEKRVKSIINSALNGKNQEPAISRVNFQGTHTKFDDEDNSNPDDNMGKEVINRLKKDKIIKPRQKGTSGKIYKKKK